VSAAFAASTASLLSLLILNNREGHNIFGNNQEPSQSDLMNALQHLDLMKALQPVHGKTEILLLTIIIYTGKVYGCIPLGLIIYSKQVL
jgi:hypothetical protein